MLDQDFYWIGTDGRERKIPNMSENEVIFALDVCLAKAGMIRDGWAKNKKVSFNPNERGRRWMLKRPAIRALMRRLIEIEEGKSKTSLQLSELVYTDEPLMKALMEIYAQLYGSN
jgi:hypothetical protein